MIGFMVTTVAVPVSIDHHPTGSELVSHTRHNLEQALVDQDLPFERLVEELGVKRSLSQTPVFQTMLNMQEGSEPASNFADLQVRHETMLLPTAKFDLMLFLSLTSDGGLRGAFEYDADLFSSDSVRTWQETFNCMASAIAQHPEQPVTLIPIVNQGDATPSTIDFKRSPASPDTLNVALAVTQWANKAPGSIAIRYGDQRITYQELEQASNRLARLLVAEGAGPDSIIGILLDRSPQVIISIIAVLKAGAAYLPLDPDFPANRLALMLSDSGAILLMTSQSLQTKLRNDLDTLSPDVIAGIDTTQLPKALLLDHESQLAALTGYSDAAHPIPDYTSDRYLDRLAYVIYTSGSTGKPKGVAISHRGLKTFLNAICSVVPIEKGDRLLALTTVGFDIAGLEIFLPILHGTELIWTNKEDSRDPLVISELIAKEGATILQATPSLWDAILEQPLPSNLLMLTGGEALTKRLATRMSQSGEVINLYGPTEATVWATSNAQAGHLENETPYPVSIGRPLLNYELYVLDSQWQTRQKEPARSG